MLNTYKIIIIILLLIIIKNNYQEKFTNNLKKNILIIGSTSKIAQVILKGEQNNNFYLISKNKEKLKKIQDEFKSTIFSIDFSKKNQIDSFFKNNKLPVFDIVFNNFHDSQYINDINYQFNTNISNNIYFLKRIFPFLKKNSKLINISSGLADSTIFSKKEDNQIYYSIIKSVI